MNARSFLMFLALILAAALGGCAAPQPNVGGSSYSSYGSYPGDLLPSGPPVPAGWANAYTPYNTVYQGRCYRYGFVQNTLDACAGFPVTPAAGQVGFPVSMATRPLAGMSPETARMLLDELARRGDPCTAERRTIATSVGAAIGAVVGAVIVRGDRRVPAAIIGALIGAAGGNSEAAMSCQAYADTRLTLMLVLDQYGCSGQVRRTNGVITDDEVCDFRRPYMPGHAPPQIADRTAARPSPK